MKKFLYIAFVIMIGTSVFMSAHNQQIAREAISRTEEANEADRFYIINQLYTWVHNDDYIARVESTKGFEVILFESTVTHREDGQNIVIPTITFLIRNIEYLPAAVGTDVVSKASVRIYDEDYYLTIPFVRTEGERGTSANFVELNHQRNFFGMLDSVGLMHFNVRLSDIPSDINSITDIVLLDGRGRVEELNIQNDYRVMPTGNIRQTAFFNAVSELITSLEGESNNRERNDITEEWLDHHNITRNAEENEGWHLGFASIMTAGMWMRIIFELGMYVLLFAVLGFFLFRKKKTPNYRAPAQTKTNPKIKF